MHIYKTTNLVNGRFYIGRERKNKESYKGSGLILRLAFKKYGFENFIKETIEECNSFEEMNEREKYWIAYYRSITPPNIMYNISSGGGGFGNTYTYHPNRQEIRDRQTATLKRRLALLTKEERKKKYGHKTTKNHVWYIDGRSFIKHYCIDNCGKQVQKENSRCNKCSNVGTKNPFYGKNIQKKQRKNTYS